MADCFLLEETACLHPTKVAHFGCRCKYLQPSSVPFPLLAAGCVDLLYLCRRIRKPAHVFVLILNLKEV